MVDHGQPPHLSLWVQTQEPLFGCQHIPKWIHHKAWITHSARPGPEQSASAATSTRTRASRGRRPWTDAAPRGLISVVALRLVSIVWGFHGFCRSWEEQCPVRFVIRAVILKRWNKKHQVKTQLWSEGQFAARGQIDPPPPWPWRSHAIWKWLRDAWLYCYWGVKRSFVVQPLALCFLKLQRRNNVRKKVPVLTKVKVKLTFQHNVTTCCCSVRLLCHTEGVLNIVKNKPGIRFFFFLSFFFLIPCI